MIEILRNFLSLIASTINTIFFIKIELSEDVTAYLGVLVIAVILFFLLMWFIFEITGVNKVLRIIFGGDEEWKHFKFYTIFG